MRTVVEDLTSASRHRTRIYTLVSCLRDLGDDTVQPGPVLAAEDPYG